MYKDKDKQREAVKQATRRYRRRVSRKTGSQRVSQEAMDDFAVPAPLQHYTSKPKPVREQSYNPMMVGYVPPIRS